MPTVPNEPQGPSAARFLAALTSLVPGRASLGMTILIFLRRIGGHLKLDEPTLETASFDGAVGNAGGHPDAADDFGARSEIGEDESAGKEAEDGRQEIRHAFFIFAQVIANEGSGVHAHEGD